MDNSSQVVEWDMDEFGLASAVTEADKRWFCLPIPDDVVKDRYLEMQTRLRAIAREFGCANAEV